LKVAGSWTRRSIPVEWVEGACLLIKQSGTERGGLARSDLFAFYEEIDLCRRVRAHGYTIGLIPRSRIHHFRGGSWESTPALHRERNFRCDRSQFIYELTDPESAVWWPTSRQDCGLWRRSSGGGRRALGCADHRSGPNPDRADSSHRADWPENGRMTE
jgi:GT2 family glycosyltransferase